MRFNIGDKVRHRGLKWLWGTVEEVFEASGTPSDDGRHYLYKVSLKQGQHYIDRGCEWEPLPGGEASLEDVPDHEADFVCSPPPESD